MMIEAVVFCDINIPVIVPSVLEEVSIFDNVNRITIAGIILHKSEGFGYFNINFKRKPLRGST